MSCNAFNYKRFFNPNEKKDNKNQTYKDNNFKWKEYTKVKWGKDDYDEKQHLIKKDKNYK